MLGHLKDPAKGIGNTSFMTGHSTWPLHDVNVKRDWIVTSVRPRISRGLIVLMLEDNHRISWKKNVMDVKKLGSVYTIHCFTANKCVMETPESRKPNRAEDTKYSAELNLLYPGIRSLAPNTSSRHLVMSICSVSISGFPIHSSWHSWEIFSHS